jgi:hypothetical protein
MKTVFPEWTDSVYRVALVALVMTVVLLAVGPMIYVRTPYHQMRDFPLDQPVQFDHRHHVRDDGIDCLYCHSTATRSPYASVPSAEVCMGCHDQIWPRSLELEPVRRSYFSGRALEWQRVHHLPDYVYFDHSIHVNKGVGCASCHGRVDEMALDRQVSPLSMGWCLDCHRSPNERLRPIDQVTSMSWRPPADADDRRALGRALARRYDVHPRTQCSTCHR